MRELKQAVSSLASGILYQFADWPNPIVPQSAAGVYTIWHQDGQFIYVGMSGRGIAKETNIQTRPKGIHTRLGSHASGRRSGDQFCVYVADRLVLPELSNEEIASIAAGEHQMDVFVRRYIHKNLAYKFINVPDGATAYSIEASQKNGEWDHGRPFLNPAKNISKLKGGSSQTRKLYDG